jgi:type IV secretory pathway VirB3-like protein
LERYGRTTMIAGVTVSVAGFKGVAAGRWRVEENEKD